MFRSRLTHTIRTAFIYCGVMLFELAPSMAEAQLNVTPTTSTATLSEALLGPDSGITITNLTYEGGEVATGTFTGGNGIIGLESGIVLTTGDSRFVIGPNDLPNAGIDNGAPGTPLIPGSFNATTVSITFIPQGDTVQFKYVFGSEEYNEYVDSVFNDAFRFFVNGTNFALIPGTSTTVEINNVNNGFAPGGQVASGPCRNCEHYIDNNDGHLNTQLDGLTRVLTLTAPVNRGIENTLIMVIADVSDEILDSAVFIQGDSFMVTPPGGGNGDVHLTTFDNDGPNPDHYDWQGTGCYNLVKSADPATSNIEGQINLVPWAPNPNASIINKLAITFPQTPSTNPHRVIISTVAPHIQVLAPASGDPDTEFTTVGNDEHVTIRFREIGGTQSLRGWIVGHRHPNAVTGYIYEVDAVYANGTYWRVFISPNAVANVTFHPRWGQTFTGLAGVFPARGHLLSRDGLQFTTDVLRADIDALNYFGRSWGCDVPLFPDPTPPSDPGFIVTVDPAELPAAQLICTTAGLPPTANPQARFCAFDVAAAVDPGVRANTAAFWAAASSLGNLPLLEGDCGGIVFRDGTVIIDEICLVIHSE